MGSFSAAAHIPMRQQGAKKEGNRFSEIKEDISFVKEIYVTVGD